MSNATNSAHTAGRDQKERPAFKLGEEDFRRGHRTNPFQFGRQKRQWQAGWDRAASAKATGDAA